MTIELQTTYRDFPPPLLAEDRIRKRLEKLERLYPRIISCHVVAEESHRRHHKGKLYSVRINVAVPGGEIVANRDHHDKHGHEDFYVAMRDAFDALERQLTSHAERLRGDVKFHETPLHGNVTKLFPDYGFIQSADGQEIYFHANSVVDGRFEKLEEGAQVRFVAAEKESEHGPQATTVQPVGKHHLN